jgi:CheY-like chemotaxis protein
MPNDLSSPDAGGLAMTTPASLHGLRVLVVEDEMMVSMLIEDMLSDLGCVVVGPASRLDEAIELAGRAEIDCAVLDVNLGGQPIFPLADILRAKGAPFAFATGYGDAGLREVDRGSPVLQKPFREGDLARVLGELRARGT